MEKIVKPGERIANVTLDGSECAVTFSSGFNVFELKNESDSDISMALESGAAAGDDGVITVPSGESFNYIHMRNVSTVYLTGTGTAAVIAKNTAVSCFSRAAKGGENAEITAANIDLAADQTAEKNIVENFEEASV